MSKKVLLATRPLTPPWDEASKNFAYFLGTQINSHSLTLLTTSTALSELTASAIQKPIFFSGNFHTQAKWKLFSYLYKARSLFDITHYLFTPTPWNTTLIKYFAKPTRGKTIQTIATLRDDLYTPQTLRRMLFADQLITYTDATKQKIQRLGHTNVTRIYPGIDLKRYCPQPKNAALLHQFGFTQEHFLVIYPGEYARLGATDMLTDVFITFFQQNPTTNIRLVFACRIKNSQDALKKEEVMRRCKQAGVLKYIAFADTIQDMPALYNTSDVILFPVDNLHGKFDVPLVIIEAYACGKPVILSDLPQFQEFSNEKICVTIPKGSPSKLIESVAYLRDNKAHCEALGYEARLFVEQHFDLKNTARQYSQVYDALA